MRVKLVTFRYSATLGGFDDTPLSDFARDKEVIAFREHFYTVNEVPHVTCVVTYQDAVVPQAALQAAREIPPRAAPAQGNGSTPRYQRRDGAPDPCEGMNENERALFNHLREWRSRCAHDEGLPPYLILTNRQIVAIVRKRPESLTALGHIDGIGPGKIERYGVAILNCLHGAAPAAVHASVAAAVDAPVAAHAPADGAVPMHAGTPVPVEVPSHTPSTTPEWPMLVEVPA